MTSYAATLSYLYGLQTRGMKFGLQNIRHLVRAAGHPERKFPSIHIAGTNGKGSTAAFIASIMMEAGCTTGLYTSPHLVRFTERIRIDGKEIPERRLVEYVRMLRPEIEAVRATFFEATTCVAFLYFADEEVDLAVLETGLGGRLDATNVLTPLVSVITNVSLDHTEYLGATVRSIAREKGGIIKKGVPCVTSAVDRGVLDVLRSVAGRKETRVFEARRLVALRKTGRGFLSLKVGRLSVGRVRPGLRGSFQLQNARLALAAVSLAARAAGNVLPSGRVSARHVGRGLERVVRNTRLRGRLETFRTDRRYILDVAHNPEGIRTLTQALEEMSVRNAVVVFGVMKDKDRAGMLDHLSRYTHTLVPVAAANPRALEVRVLRREAERAGIRTVRGGSVLRGLKSAASIAGRGTEIVVTGSHYVVGEALRYFGRA